MQRGRIWVAICTALTLTVSARAGVWHVGESLPCGQCHAQHASVGGEAIAGGPYSVLLLRASVDELCLSCHDGSDPTAPDVMAPVAMYAQGKPPESAGGHLVQTGTTHVSGHDLGLPAQIPLNEAGRSMTLTCGTCHDYHGNSNYRNLRFDPAGVGDSILIVAGRDVFWNTSPGLPPSANATAAAYRRENIGYRSGLSVWCASCHDQIAIDAPAPPPAHFHAHPTNVAFGGFSGSAHVDASHWVDGKGEGFQDENAITGEGIPRLPFLQPAATDFATSQQVASSNELFCGTCHAAHGTTFARDLRWPYVEGGVNYLSGCQQCHFK